MSIGTASDFVNRSRAASVRFVLEPVCEECTDLGHDGRVAVESALIQNEMLVQRLGGHLGRYTDALTSSSRRLPA